VERWIERGLSPKEAARKSMDESRGVIAIAFGLSAVFIPVRSSRASPPVLRQFALTIATSTLISAFNSLTLSPALAALILKPAAMRAGPGFCARDACSPRHCRTAGLVAYLF